MLSLSELVMQRANIEGEWLKRKLLYGARQCRTYPQQFKLDVLCIAMGLREPRSLFKHLNIPTSYYARWCTALKDKS